MAREKTILITGATAGIGRCSALYLARKGHHVIATGRSDKALAGLRDEAAGAKLDTVRLDVTDAASIEATVREVDRITAGRGVDVLVNNAGYGLVAPLIETPDAELRGQFETNVLGLMAVTRAFGRPMLVRRAGRIINIGSIGGRVAFPFFGAYNATKYAVEALSDALRRELAPFGVAVALVEPGPIRSEFADRSVQVLDRHRTPGSPYERVLARAEKVRARTDAASAGPEVVARAIEHAATARRPRTRYVVPKSSAAFLWLVSILPTRWLDALLTRPVGLTSRGVNAVPEPRATEPRPAPAETSPTARA